jgi:hypothetical protein
MLEFEAAGASIALVCPSALPVGAEEQGMLLSGSPREQAIKVTLGMSPSWFAIWVVLFLVVALHETPPIWLLLRSGALGLLAAILAVVSLRYYNFWLSRFWWLLPILPLVLLLEPVNTGELSVMSIVEALAFGSFVAYGLLWLLRARLLAWIN